MSKPDQMQTKPVLDEEICELIADAIVPFELSVEKKQSLHEGILERIGLVSEQESLHTVRKHQGSWVQVARKMAKKQLYVDRVRGIETYLLRIDPGAEFAAHSHLDDEYCLVLQGCVEFADLKLQKGDFHLARKGSHHGRVISTTGALLYLQGALSEAASI